MTPPFPLIAITLKNASLELVTEDYPIDKAGALHVIKSDINDTNYFDKDDDLITQFVDSHNLKAKLLTCSNFSSIVVMLSEYVFYPDEDKIYKEFPPEE